MRAPEFGSGRVGRHCDHLPFREAEGVVLYDQDADQLVTGPDVFHVSTPTGIRIMRLRVARGVIGDLREEKAVQEERT